MNRGHSQLSVATLDAFGNHCLAKLVSSRQKSLTGWLACEPLAIKLLTQPRAGPPISSTFFLRIYLTMAHLYVALGGAPPSLLPTYLLEVAA